MRGPSLEELLIDRPWQEEHPPAAIDNAAASESEVKTVPKKGRVLRRINDAGRTFVQYLGSCNKPNCGPCQREEFHGPYWREEKRVGKKLVSKYIGKELDTSKGFGPRHVKPAPAEKAATQAR